MSKFSEGLAAMRQPMPKASIGASAPAAKEEATVKTRVMQTVFWGGLVGGVIMFSAVILKEKS